MKIAKRAVRPGFVAAHAAALAVRYERGQLALTEPGDDVAGAAARTMGGGTRSGRAQDQPEHAAPGDGL